MDLRAVDSTERPAKPTPVPVSFMGTISAGRSTGNGVSITCRGRCGGCGRPTGIKCQPGSIGGTLPMSLNTRLDALKERHASLETRIFDEDQRPRPDSDTLTRLKIEKLHVKEEIEKLRTQTN